MLITGSRRFKRICSRAKVRLDKLTAELRGLEQEKKLRQADAILQALSKSGKSLDDVLTFLGR